MKQIISLIIVLPYLAGCVSATPKKNNITDIDNLTGASYKFDKNKKLTLQKEYRHKGKRRVVTTHTSVQGVPSFSRGYKKSLSLRGKKKKEILIKGDKVKVSVENIPLNEFVTLVFGSVLKLNYTQSAAVKKLKTPITLNMQDTQDSKQFYEVVKKVLSLNGVSLNTKDGMLFVEASSKKSNMALDDIYVGYGRSIPSYINDEQMVLLFVPYYYIKPGNTVNMLRQIGVNDIKFFYYINGVQTMKGKASDIRKALKLVDLLDRPFLEGKKSYLLALDNIDVNTFLSKMKQIFSINAINVSASPSQGGIVMLPIEDLNMLYVITPKKEWLDMLLYWKERLDVPSQTSQEPRYFIYHVKNRKADELAAALKGVLGATGGTKKQSTKASTDGKKSTSSESLLSMSGGYTPSISVDKDTNILMLKLTAKDYRVMLPFIEELDKLPLQTLVEVTVADVDMTDTFSLGFEHAIQNTSADLISNTLNITGGGGGLGLVFKGNYIESIINAYSEKKLLDILSRPRILILNNNTGTINVGTEVPIITSEVSSTDGASTTSPGISRNITYRTTGINLGLTPTINSNGVLTMNISIDLSEAQLNDTSGIDSPLIVNRSLNTVAVIHSGDTILVGGLISHNNSNSKGGVPYLKDIPYIGDVFANTSHKVVKTELIMLIRPTIIRTRQEVVQETYKFKKLLQFLQTADL